MKKRKRWRPSKRKKRREQIALFKPGCVHCPCLASCCPRTREQSENTWNREHIWISKIRCYWINLTFHFKTSIRLSRSTPCKISNFPKIHPSHCDSLTAVATNLAPHNNQAHPAIEQQDKDTVEVEVGQGRAIAGESQKDMDCMWISTSISISTPLSFSTILPLFCAR